MSPVRRIRPLRLLRLIRRSLPALPLLAACGVPSKPPSAPSPTPVAASRAPAADRDSPAPPSAEPPPSAAPPSAAPFSEPSSRVARPSSEPSSSSPSPDPPASAPARLRAAGLREVSGLAASRRDAGVLWAINDSGNAPRLFALGRDGRALGSWPVTANNRDWEDLAALRLGGEPYLLVADTGDNLRRHDDYALHLVAEPIARGADARPGTELRPRRTIRFRYEDGAHDVEAVAVDEPSGTVWLLVKEPTRGGGGTPSGVYTLPLADENADGTLLVARRAATLARVPPTLETRLAATFAGVDLEQPTAFDIAPDGRTACLLSYRHVRCFARAPGEDWAAALSRPGETRTAHDLDQAEALTLSADGQIRFTSEGVGAPLRSLPLSPGDT